jgi:hypothetical protein
MTRRIVQWSISIALVGYIVWFLVDRWDVLAGQFEGTATHAGLLVVGVLATWVVSSMQTLLPLRELGVRVGFWENLVLTLAASFGNYLPLRAGTILRLQYIKAVHGVGYLRYGGVLGIRTLLLVAVAGLVGLCGAAAMSGSGHAVRGGVFILFAALLAAGLGPLLVPVHRLLPSSGLSGRVAAELAGALALIHRNHRMTAYYVALILLQFAILTMRLAVAFDALQQQPVPWVYCFLSPVATILSFISLTPGNLGLREWVIGVVTAGVGFDYAAGIFAATVDRAIAVITLFILGGLASVAVTVWMTRHTVAVPAE